MQTLRRRKATHKKQNTINNAFGYSTGGVACDKMTMYMDLLCLCHSTCLRYNESAGLTRRCMSFYARRANCQPPLIAPFDLCRLNSERNSYIRITTQAESALSCGGYW